MAAAPVDRAPGRPRRRPSCCARSASAGAPCAPRGGGTKLGWGGGRRAGAVELETGGLDRDPRAQRGRLHRGARGRRAARRGAGDVRRATGQMLALDPPLGAGDAATIGGVVATADSGPLRHRYGGVRDLVVGHHRRAVATARSPRRAAR